MTIRSKLPSVTRTLLGLAFAVFGANFFLHFLPDHPEPPEAGAYLGALFAGKIFSVIKPIEIAAGLLLIGNRYVPLALTVLAPIEVAIVLFHGVFDPAGLAIPLVLVAFTLYLAWAYRAAFAPMLQARVEPTAVEPVVHRERVAA